MSEQQQQNASHEQDSSSPSGENTSSASENEQTSSNGSSWTERIEVASAEVLETIKSLIHEGNVRRVNIKKADGKQLLSIPVTAGAAIGGVAVLAAPTIAAIAALTALLTKVTLEVERTDKKADPSDGEGGDSIVSAEVVDDAE